MILSVATFALLISTGSQMAAPLFFGLVINAANNSNHDGMGIKKFNIYYVIY